METKKLIIDASKFKDEYFHRVGTQFDNAIMEMSKERFSVDAVPISKRATVGDMMKAMFPSFKIDDRLSDVIIMESYYPIPFCKMQFDKKVWDMPYEVYKEKEENMKDIEYGLPFMG